MTTLSETDIKVVESLCSDLERHVLCLRDALWAKDAARVGRIGTNLLNNATKIYGMTGEKCR